MARGEEPDAPGDEPGDGVVWITRPPKITFGEIRRFEAAWSVFLAKRTEADFAAYRRHQAFEAWKQAMWAAGRKLPTQVAEGCSVCFCGAAIGFGDVERHVLEAHMKSPVEGQLTMTD